MLTGCLFENRVSVRILGDTSDLISLHKTVRRITVVIVDYELNDTSVSNLLVDFLENIEKAIYKNLTVSEGFESSWTELLMISRLLRLLSGYVVTDELDEINMLLLEYIIGKTISPANEQEYIGLNNYIEQEFLCVNIKQFIRSFDCIINKKNTYEKH